MVPTMRKLLSCGIALFAPTLFALTLFALVVARPASAASVGYGSLVGSNVSFLGITESSTTDALPLYGAPTVTGDSIQLFPLDFLSQSLNGASDTTEGILTLRIQADPGQFITAIDVSEFGDYQVFGAQAQASVDASLAVTDVMGVHMKTDSIQQVFNSGVDPVAGNFANNLSVDFTGLGVSAVDLVFRNQLETSTGLGSVAFIQKKIISGPTVSVRTEPAVPEPTAFLAFAAGLLVIGAGARRATVYA